MNNSIFWLRAAYAIILVTLTICYIFGDVIQVWDDWISGLAYGLALSGLMETHSKRHRMSNVILWRRKFYLFILVTLTLCYIFGSSLTWWDWFSGVAYGLAFRGLMVTLEDKSLKRRRRIL